MKGKEVNAYLKKKGLPAEIHSKTYEFFGGRINDLKSLVFEININGLSFEGIMY